MDLQLQKFGRDFFVYVKSPIQTINHQVSVNTLICLLELQQKLYVLQISP